MLNERESVQTALEFLGKFFATQGLIENRAAYAPLGQTNGLYDRELAATPKALKMFQDGDISLAQKVLNGVIRKEAAERAQANFAPTFHAHHGNTMAGLAMLTPDLNMKQHNQAVQLINAAGIPTGTDRFTLMSYSPRLGHQAAHTDQVTQRTGQFHAGEIAMSKHRQTSPEKRVKAALPELIWENQMSLAAAQHPGEQHIRHAISQLSGIPIEDLLSVEQDTRLKKGSSRSVAASNYMALKEGGLAPVIKGIEEEALRVHGKELLIPVMYKQEHASRPGVYSDWKLATTNNEGLIKTGYIDVERPGLGEAIDNVLSMPDYL